MWHYIDAMEVFWNSYVLVYDSGAQRLLFRSAQDRVQSWQLELRKIADEWIGQAHVLSDRVSALIPDLIGTASFWIMVVMIVAAVEGYQHRRILKTYLQIWRIRWGGSTPTESVVEHLFYRAARLAEHKVPKRQTAQTWREWIIGLPDPHRRSVLARALVVFEKSRYGRMPISSADFALLEDAVREMKL